MKSYEMITVRYYVSAVIGIFIAVIFLKFADYKVWDWELSFSIAVGGLFLYAIFLHVLIERYVKSAVDSTAEANNIKRYPSGTESKFLTDMKELLPSYRGKTIYGDDVFDQKQKRKVIMTPQYYGQFEDINMSFIIEKLYFSNKVPILMKKHDTGFNGDVLIIEDSAVNFGQQWITFQSNRNLRCPDEISVRTDEYVLANGQGRLFFGPNNDIDHQLIIDYFEANNQLFSGEEDLIVFLRGTQFIYCHPNIGEKPLICSPIWTPSLFEKKVNESKRSIYVFNQLLVNISHSFNTFK